jgi:non-homologous end joining protein Ku
VIVEDADLQAIMSRRLEDDRDHQLRRRVRVDRLLRPHVLPRPGGGAAAAACVLLRAMQESGKAGLGRFVRQGMTSVPDPAEGDALTGDAVHRRGRQLAGRDREAVSGSEVKEAELGLAREVIDSLEGEFDPTELTSEYRQT